MLSRLYRVLVGNGPCLTFGSLELVWSLVKQKSSSEDFMEHSSVMKASPQKGGSWLCSTRVLYVLCPKYVVSSVAKKLSLIS